MDELFETTGVLNYGDKSYSVLNIDPEIGRLYRSFIPKHVHWLPPMWSTHITVTRTGVEKIPNRKFWGKYYGCKFKIQYSPCIMFGATYIWLPAFSKDLEEIRLELGLPRHFNSFQQFHITIANMKGTKSQGKCIDFDDFTLVYPDKNYNPENEGI